MVRGRDEWGGSRATRMGAKVREVYGNECWLCGAEIARAEFSVDHVLLKSTHPHLMWELSNMRPAHLRCNKVRGTRMARPLRRLPPPSREW